MCVPCNLMLHEECMEPIELDAANDRSNCCCSRDEGSIYPELSDAVRTISSTATGEREYKDQTSTGRKRAAQLKPIIEDMVCEWAKLRYAGGGVTPIIGCEGVILTKEKGNEERTGNIHHGPDKSTLNNTDANLHRICSRCHNRWHYLNDPYYPKERPANGAPFIPQQGYAQHDKHTLATDEERAYHEAWWKTPQAVRDQLPYRKQENNV